MIDLTGVGKEGSNVCGGGRRGRQNCHTSEKGLGPGRARERGGGGSELASGVERVIGAGI
jgi:hypothetical protein